MIKDTLEDISRIKYPLTDKGKLIDNIPGKIGLNIWELYDSFFYEYKDKEISLLEFGFGANGHCIKTFCDYFPNAKNIIGADYEKNFLENIKFEDPRVKTYHVDQHDMKSLNNLADVFREQGVKFDIIVDDAAHTPLGITNSFLSFFDMLNDGGIFIIEGTYMLVDELHNRRHNILTDLQIAANEDTDKYPWSPIMKGIQYVYTCRGITIIKKGKHITNL